MKISFVVTTHQSKKISPKGNEDLKGYIESLFYNIKEAFYLYIIDNSSEIKIEHPLLKMDNVSYEYIEDQTKKGLTGAWNLGIKKAIDDGSDIIMNTNNDIEFYDEQGMSDFIKTINNHPYKDVSLFGPVTNKEGQISDLQVRNGPGKDIIEVTGRHLNGYHGEHLNGFFNAFTKEFFYNFNMNGNLYSTEEDLKWSGQEIDMCKRLEKKGMRSFIVEFLHVIHNKRRSWKKQKNR